uniref:Uncharacterized protein n=1 Tax=Timema bartmani TaxID=61472 RepID=A0A7R9I7Y3_9NEOP|nr:unnamed protein product [Timema bartmani]
MKKLARKQTLSRRKFRAQESHLFAVVPSEKKLSPNKTLSSRLWAKCLMNKHLQLRDLSTMLDPLRHTILNETTLLTMPPVQTLMTHLPS